MNKNASKLGKLSHKKKPRSKEFYQEMGRKGNEKIKRMKESGELVVVDGKLQRKSYAHSDVAEQTTHNTINL